MSRANIFSWTRERPLMGIVSFLLLIDLVLVFFYCSRTQGVLTVAFLSVGQGDAVYIEAPNGNQMLYDAGPPSGAVLRELGRVMPLFDRSIDVAVLSHPDLDHIGGFPEVFDRYAVYAVLESGADSKNGVWDTTKRSIAEHRVNHLVARKGMTIDLGGGVRADILYPDRDTSTMETNDASIVLRIHYGDTAFLLSGDLPQNIENYQVALYGDTLRAQVLKLGHHGSRTSSSEEWLRAVDPDIAVTSAGLKNRYGHPHQEVVALLERLHIPHLVTFNEGTIRFMSDGHAVVRK